MIELYHTAVSTCSQKVRMTLAEKGLEFVSRNVNLRANEHLTPEYLKLNPNGLVPTLVHDGHVILDSSVICEYLDEVFPQPRLSPDDAVGRAHMRKWLRFLEEVPTAAIRVPTMHMAIRPFEGIDQKTYRAERADVRPLRKHLYRKMGAEGFPTEEVAASLDQLDLTLQRMEEVLSKGKSKQPWLMGQQFTLADIVVLPAVDRLDDLGMSHMWDRYPGVTEWYARIRKRPSYDAAYYPGTRISTSGLTIKPLSADILRSAASH